MVATVTRRLTQNSFNESLERFIKTQEVNYCFLPEENEVFDLALSIWGVFSIDVLKQEDYLDPKDYYQSVRTQKNIVRPIDKMRFIRELFPSEKIKKACEFIVGFDPQKKEPLKQIIVALNSEKS